MKNLHLEATNLDDADIEALVKALSDPDCPFTQLNISYNTLSQSAVDQLGTGIEHNISLRELLVRKCFEGSMERFTEGLKKNATLQILDLSSNALENEGISLLGEALQVNTGIWKL